MTLIEASLLEQRFAFKLRVQNPNDMDIPVTGMSFEIKLNDQSFAKGVSNKPVTLARLSETMLEVTAVSDLSVILRQINELRLGNRSSVSYLIKGRLITGAAVGLNFENSGMLDFPTPAPGEKR
jgi:LEA14-like dessication related protein